MEMSGQLHDPDALNLISTVEEARWAPEPVWALYRKEKKSLAPAVIKTQIPRLSSP
jgi:hypothetical protein